MILSSSPATWPGVPTSPDATSIYASLVNYLFQAHQSRKGLQRPHWNQSS